MTPAGLPDGIAGLRAQLAAGALDVAQALALQRPACEADGWHCVVALPDDAGEPPQASLPLAGVGLAHKDIFVLPGHVPECGARHPWPDAPVRAATVIRRLAAAGSRPLAALAARTRAIPCRAIRSTRTRRWAARPAARPWRWPRAFAMARWARTRRGR